MYHNWSFWMPMFPSFISQSHWGNLKDHRIPVAEQRINFGLLDEDEVLVLIFYQGWNEVQNCWTKEIEWPLQYTTWTPGENLASVVNLHSKEKTVWALKKYLKVFFHLFLVMVKWVTADVGRIIVAPEQRARPGLYFMALLILQLY